jgi:hypothetical protein
MRTRLDAWDIAMKINNTPNWKNFMRPIENTIPSYNEEEDVYEVSCDNAGLTISLYVPKEENLLPFIKNYGEDRRRYIDLLTGKESMVT